MGRSIYSRSRIMKPVRFQQPRTWVRGPVPCIHETFNGTDGGTGHDLVWEGERHTATSKKTTSAFDQSSDETDGATSTLRVADNFSNEFGLHRWDASELPAGHDYLFAWFHTVTDVSSIGTDQHITMTVPYVPTVEPADTANGIQRVDWILYARAGLYPGGVDRGSGLAPYATGIIAEFQHATIGTNPAINHQARFSADTWDDFAYMDDGSPFNLTSQLTAGETLGLRVTGAQNDPLVEFLRNDVVFLDWQVADGYDTPFYYATDLPFGTMAGYGLQMTVTQSSANGAPLGWPSGTDYACRIDDWTCCPP